MPSTNKEALARLLAENWPHAYRVAWTVLRNPAEAEDATQEACARALRSSDSLRDPGSFRSWFYRIVVNEARGRLRMQRFDEVLADDPKEFEAPDERIDVHRAIDRLGALDRLAIVLFYYAELPTAEIANVMQSTPLAVRLRLMMARRRLRAFLNPDEPNSLPQRNAL
jgi:RNA polymerase sigma-70 factor, ECF subfamily